MAAFCGACGKPVAAGGKFCGGCGAPNSLKSGSPALKIVLAVVLLVGAALLIAAGGAFLFGRKKIAELREKSGAASRVLPHSTAAGGSALLTMDEVGAIIGVPVTSIKMTGASDASYQTATEGMEAGIEIEHEDGESGAIQSLDAARLVSQKMAGGNGEKIAGLGDDAVYGAFNVLYVRKNDIVLTITPPNLQQAAQLKQVSYMNSQPVGSEEQLKALQKLQEMTKNDPTAASLSKPDAVSGAVDVIQHSAADRGNAYETQARLMARQMAEKVLAKIGT
jgi:hypothetical protein